MGIRPSGETNDGEGTQYAVDQIGHVYSNVKKVADNIEDVNAVADVAEDIATIVANLPTISEAVDAAATAVAAAAAADADATAAHNDMLAADADAASALASKNAAALSEANALAYKNAAELARDQAQTAEANAELAETNSETAASASSTSAAAAALSEANAETSENAAGVHAGNALTSENNAETAAAAAAGSAANADASEAQALIYRNEALQFRNEAEAIAGGDYITTAEKGAANGVMPLGPDGKASVAFLPDAVLGSMRFQTTWDASTNTPAIPAAAEANRGHYYIVNVAGTTVISGINDWQVGDWVVSNGASWAKVDNSDKVSSVAGKTGAVTLDKFDVGLGNVPNLAAADLPVSTAQQAALDLKAKLDGGNAFVGAQSIDQQNQTHVPAINITNIGAGQSGIRFARAGAAGLLTICGTSAIGGGTPWTFDSTHRSFAFKVNNNADDASPQVMYIGNQGTLTRGLMTLKHETAAATGDYLAAKDSTDVVKLRLKADGGAEFTNVVKATAAANGHAFVGVGGSGTLMLQKDATPTRAVSIGLAVPGNAAGEDMIFMKYSSANGWGELGRFVHATGLLQLQGAVTAAGNVTSTGGSLVTKALAGANAHVWFQNEADVTQGLVYWDRAGDTLQLVRYNAAGNAAEGSLILGATALTMSGTQFWVNSDKLLIQHDGANGYVRAQTGALVLGAAGTNRMTIQADGNTVLTAFSFAVRDSMASGFAQLNSGNADNTGYICFYNAAGTRLGYIGFADATYLNLVAEAGRSFKMIGNVEMTAALSMYRSDGNNPIINFKKGVANTFSIQCDENTLYQIGPNLEARAGSHYWKSENGATAFMTLGLDGGVPRLTINNGNCTMRDLTVTRGDSTGAIYFGGGSEYLYWDNANFNLTDDLVVSGNITSPSDRRLKKNISYRFHYGLADVCRLAPVSYNWKKGKGKDRGAKEIGLIAQDVQAIAPELVHEAKDGTLSVNYEKLSILLLAAVKELTARVEKLEA